MNRLRPPRRRALLIVENLSVPFDRRVWTEAETLRAAGWQVVAISPRGEGGWRWHETIQGVEVFRYPLPTTATGLTAHLLEYAVALPMTLLLALLVRLRGRIDVVQACNPPDFLFPIGRLLRTLGAAFVFDQHDLGPELYLAQGGRRGGAVHRLLLWAERQTYRAADAVIATNETYRRFATARGGLPADQVFVVRTAPDPGRIYRVEPDPARKAGRRWLVVYLGTMGVQDGVDLFLRAAAAIARRRPGQVRFLAVGGGDELEALRRLATSLDLDDDLGFTGRIPDDELRVVLSSADLGVSPDPKNGFNEFCTMNKTLEYMAVGLPVAAFDLEETRVSGGDAAAYAQPNDPDALATTILELLDDPARRAALGRVGLERMGGSLSWAASADRLLAAYQRAVDRRQADQLAARD
ncbi:MAG TPA: glycosyltransferase family 4 protein [Candidatus Limnocylindrales bacterium]|nr:glycosyltransferase family 4 protein [Candidatus Limnocylindrales bacterium]